jgi:eukaryotic-like serine/threonine-protein kinase
MAARLWQNDREKAMPSVFALDRVLAGRAPDVFGRYELLGRLGAGGMAEVFVARCGDLPGMQSLVALKRILPHLADDEDFVSLFRREAQISLRLQHRAIARVFEVGRVDAAWFLAMELVPGEALAHLLRAERERAMGVDPRVAAWVGAEIALALQHAHALSDGTTSFEVVHRDVSPQNVLLGFDGMAKLIDFGVARCARLSDATRAGTVRGKLAYASPEQLESRPLDGRSDLFSLAAVLHEWLAGTPLFERDSDAATVRAVQAAVIPPLPRAPRLGAVLARALARDRALRFPDGEALAAALLDAVGGPPAAPDRLVAEHVAALFPDRKRRWQAITAGLDAGAVGGAVAHARGGETAPGTPLARELPRRGASGTRRRTRRGLAVAVVVGAASLVLGWARHDRAPASRLAAAAPPLSSSVPAPATRVAAPPGPPPAPEAGKTRVSAPPPAPPARAGRETAAPGRRRLHPGVTHAARSGHRAIVDELEPSPYKKPR